MIQSFNWRPAVDGLLWNVFGNGYYNFKMTDYGANAAVGHRHGAAHQPVRRVDRHAVRPGRHETPWSLQLLGILRGPMWYNTEESLSPLSSRARSARQRLPERRVLGLEHRAARSK